MAIGGSGRMSELSFIVQADSSPTKYSWRYEFPDGGYAYVRTDGDLARYTRTRE